MYGKEVIADKTEVKIGVGVIILDSVKRILLERRSDNGLWSLPGGSIDPGETFKQAIIREAKEETNLDIEISTLLGLYSSPKEGRIVIYPDNGDVRHIVDAVFIATITGGNLQKSHESIEIKFFDKDNLPRDIAPPVVKPLNDYLSGEKLVID